MKSVRSLSLSLLVVAVAASVVDLPAFAQSPQSAAPVSRIAGSIDEANRVALSGNVHPLAQARYDRGPAPQSMPTGRVVLLLQRSAAQQQALTQYLADVQNPSSSSFHQWLTPAQYGAAYGISDSDLQTIESWLVSHGFKIEKVPQGRNVVQFSGTIGQIETAFHTSIHTFQIAGAAHYANVSDPQIPTALAPVVAAVGPLNDFHPAPPLVLGPRGHFDTASGRILPDLTLENGSGQFLLFEDPADAATIYDVPNTNLNANYTSGTTYDGTGITIGVAGVSNIPLSDIENFRTAFLGETTTNANLPAVIVDGDDPGLPGGGWEDEAILDNEVSGGMAPKAKIDFYTSADTDLSSGFIDAVYRAIDDNAVSILSMSIAECEQSLGSAGNAEVLEASEQAAAQGITVVVASSDSGSAGCDNFDTAAQAQYGFAVNGFASTPYNVAVGGTDYDALPSSFSTYVSTTSSGTAPYYRTALSYIPENPWNDSTTVDSTYANNTPAYNSAGQGNIVASSGGVSTIYGKPSFQSSLTPTDSHRDVPDVSMFAANGFYGAAWVFCSDNVADGVTTETYTECQNTNGQFSSSTLFGGIGGTSAAAPAFAGFLALLEQAQGGARLGQADNVLYQLAQSKYSTVFHDIATGNNSVPCAGGSPDCGSNGFLTGYNAGTGYDLTTGLGSVDVKQLIANWSSVALHSTSTSLTIDGSTAAYSGTHGQSLTFAVGVTPAPAGNTEVVGIIDTANETSGGATAGPQSNGQLSISLTSGSGSATWNGLPGGTYTVSAHYGGDTSGAASTSAPISVTISPEASTTALEANAYNPLTGSPVLGATIPYGSEVLLDAQIEGTAEGSATRGIATGTVTFSNGSTSLGTAKVTASSNVASYPPESQPWIPTAGTYNFTASYPGDASYKASTSAAVPFTIAKAPTSITLTNPSYLVYGIYGAATSSTYFPLTIQTPYNPGVAPTGTVTTSANGQVVNTVSNLTGILQGSGTTANWLISTSGSVPDPDFQSGSNTITVAYSGDANYGAATETITVTDKDGVGSLALTSGGDISLIAGQYANVTITVTPSGGFYSSVTLTESGLPPGVSLTGNTSLGVVSAPVSASLYLQTPYTLAPGTYPVTVTATDAIGKITASTTFNLVVTGLPANAGFSLSNGGALTIGAGSQINSASVTFTPANGYVGEVNFACAITTSMSNVASAPTCQGFSQGFPVSVTATFQIPIITYETTTAGAYTVTVTATDANNSAISATTAMPLTIVAYSGVLISINPFTLTVGAGVSTGDTLAITLTPSGGFTGNVNLTCVALSSPAPAVSPAQCVVPSSLDITSANPVMTTVTANTTPSTTLGSYNFGINVYDASTGVFDSGTDITVIVQAGPGLALSTSGNITVSPGATTGNTSTITVTPSNGFTGQVNLSCSLTTLPPGVNDPPTCSVPSSVTISGTTASTATLTVNTTAPSSSAIDPPLKKFFLGGGGAVLALVLFFGIPARRRAWRALFSLLALAVIVSAIGCGGGGGGTGGGGGGGNAGTSAGAYVVTVTGTDIATGKITSSVTVNITVN